MEIVISLEEGNLRRKLQDLVTVGAMQVNLYLTDYVKI